MTDKRKRRFWDDAEKIRIIAQTRVPGVSVAQVARRYDVNANLIFKWLRDPRFSSAPDPGVDFLPVTITADPGPLPLKISRPAVPAPAEVRVEITTPGGCKLRVEGGLDVSGICELVRGLER
jgi:transposase